MTALLKRGANRNFAAICPIPYFLISKNQQHPNDLPAVGYVVRQP